MIRASQEEGKDDAYAGKEALLSARLNLVTCGELKPTLLHTSFNTESQIYTFMHTHTLYAPHESSLPRCMEDIDMLTHAQTHSQFRLNHTHTLRQVWKCLTQTLSAPLLLIKSSYCTKSNILKRRHEYGKRLLEFCD